MTWNIFRSKPRNEHQSRPNLAKEAPRTAQSCAGQSTALETRSDNTLPNISRSKQYPRSKSAQLNGKYRVLSPSAPPLVANLTRLSQRPRIDPESAPLGEIQNYLGILHEPSNGLTSAKSHNASKKVSKQRSTHSLRSVLTYRSVNSARSFNSASSADSFRSSHSQRICRSSKHSQTSLAARHIKAAREAKNATSAYIAANRGTPFCCYTCGHEFLSIQCPTCHTYYLPPHFKYRVCGEIISGSIPSYEDLNHKISPKFTGGKSPTNIKGEVTTIKGNGQSGRNTGVVNIGDTIKYWGVLPEDENSRDTYTSVDLDFMEDLAANNEVGLLEIMLFECFCNPVTIAQTFLQSGESAVHGSIVNNKEVSRMYDILSSLSSTGPIRGILQGAQKGLLTRKHAPISDKDLVYICVILQCPAICDCSMFTKITGPMQKLSKYASLRSRARIILEICAGLVVHSPQELHLEFSKVFLNMDILKLREIVDLCNAYVSHRLSFDFHYKSKTQHHPSKFNLIKHEWYAEDWRIIVVVKLISLFWASNVMRTEKSHRLPISSFYNTMVDLVSVNEDFDSWQSSLSRKSPRFCFCRYPFLMSIGTKARVLEHAIQREVNASIQREFFASMTHPYSTRDSQARQYVLRKNRTFKLRIRRQNLLEDSIRQLKDWPNSQRPTLRVEFSGEPGIDAGGLKKEWFLLFYQGLFDPELGVFEMDGESNYCWFSKTAKLDYCRVAGTVLGLAIFNAITIDLNLPLLLFKLLLDEPYDLNDICILWPQLGQSFQSILDYEQEDFEDVFGLTFTGPDGALLIDHGDEVNVTLENKETYVRLMVEHLVGADREPLKKFKSSFLSVCNCNAITLFQPEELELLVRGDRQPIDVPVLRSVTKYVNFGHRYEKANEEPVVQWFWEYFEKLDPSAQAQLLQFVTSTDRAPAAGMVQMRFSIMCLGGDSERLPIAHTCFNQLCIYKYKTRSKLENKLSLAVAEYQGFGLK